MDFTWFFGCRIRDERGARNSRGLVFFECLELSGLNERVNNLADRGKGLSTVGMDASLLTEGSVEKGGIIRIVNLIFVVLGGLNEA